MQNLIQGKDTDVLYLDYAKAFDKVDHSILIEKLKIYRILDLTKQRCHIFNVGHGLTPEVKINNVKYVIKLIDNC